MSFFRIFAFLVYIPQKQNPLAGPPVSQGGGLRPPGPGGRSDARGGLTISGDSPLRDGEKQERRED